MFLVTSAVMSSDSESATPDLMFRATVRQKLAQLYERAIPPAIGSLRRNQSAAKRSGRKALRASSTSIITNIIPSSVTNPYWLKNSLTDKSARVVHGSDTLSEMKIGMIFGNIKTINMPVTPSVAIVIKIG